MKKVCFLLQVKPDRLEAYREVHVNVWPEMRDALSRHGWHNYSLFLRDDGMLVGYVETEDFEKALAGMQEEDVNSRWQDKMKDYFTELKGGAVDTSLEILDQVFYLE